MQMEKLTEATLSREGSHNEEHTSTFLKMEIAMRVIGRTIYSMGKAPLRIRLASSSRDHGRTANQMVTLKFNSSREKATVVDSRGAPGKVEEF